MYPSNVVVLRGRVTSEPRRRELPSGSVVVSVEVTTRSEGLTASVPVEWIDPTIELTADTDVVVVGHVRRRFFRVRGATESRTEVVAERIVPAGRTREVRRAVDRAVAALAEAPA
jgi:single-strand DNA-binding protein